MTEQQQDLESDTDPATAPDEDAKLPGYTKPIGEAQRDLDRDAAEAEKDANEDL